MKKLLIFTTFVFSSLVASVDSKAVEVICKKLSRQGHSLNYRKLMFTTPEGPQLLYTSSPTVSLFAVPAHVPAGPKGENLKPGECGMASAPFAPQFTELVMHVYSGDNFSQTTDARGVTRAHFTETSGVCCKVFKFEAEFSAQPTHINMHISLPKAGWQYL